VILTTAFYADGKEKKICATSVRQNCTAFFHGFVSGQSEMLEYAAFRRVAGLRGMPANLTNGEDP
jgi:hypothetical protein